MQTLKDVLKAMFPYGTSFPEVLGWRRRGQRRKVAFDAPDWPPDLFAFVAKLLDLSGAYHHVVPASPAPPKTGLRRLQISDAQLEACVIAGAAWRAEWNSGKVPAPKPALVAKLWSELSSRLNAPIYEALNDFARPPEWWSLALQLLVLSDEASFGLGLELTKPDPSGGSAEIQHFLNVFKLVLGTEVNREDGQFDENFFSISFANENVASVMPKSRTPRVGCTLRSLSHNLALLPPRGEVRVRWGSYDRDPGTTCDDPLKLLVIPYPYSISDKCFSVAGAEPGHGESWGWFKVDARWLGAPSDMRERADAFAAFVVDLVTQAGCDGIPVNGVILPEASLNEAYYRALVVALLDVPGVEFLINGATESQFHKRVVTEEIGTDATMPDTQREGNFVSQTLFLSSRGTRQAVRTIRQKHHRWRLDESQIRQYGLQHILDTDKLWWERIDITSRSVDVMAIRPGATVTSLICEDLARVDPCQAAVRAVGPTLLVSLLMDGSQLSGRWPGRYATVLSEDPGCSVLTLTSLGLIARTDPATISGATPKRSIGLWRDGGGGTVELILDPGAHAVAFTVRAHMEMEQTLDGRSDDKDAVVWRLDVKEPKDRPRSIAAAVAPPSWLLDCD
ncbi:hypothetical protein [Sphingomonas soli]|uniref:hypothetical protein n=1 Tax=Sphingomonas soli TaxID=266127 RepID=UPI000AFC491B|nr:hypothetical protein [Sphingomonas soli]